jgi:predicted GNAT family N-acyltransferase
MAENKYALIIANAEYPDLPLPKLEAPLADARLLSDLLESPDIGGFNVVRVLDKSLREVSKTLESFFRDRKRDDLSLLYISGHGLKADSELYFAVKDSCLARDLSTPMKATVLSAQFVREAMRTSDSMRQVLILDCCYSAAAAPEGMVSRGFRSADVDGQFQEVGGGFEGEGRGMVLLTASLNLQEAFECQRSGDQHVSSVFTSSMVAGIKTGEADLDKDGIISLDELYYYIKARMVLSKPKQTPGLFIHGSKRRIDLVKAPKTESAFCVPPQDVDIPITPAPRYRRHAEGRRDLEVAVCITDEGVSQHIIGLLNQLVTSGAMEDAIPQYQFHVASFQTPNKAFETLRKHHPGDEEYAAILLFDISSESLNQRGGAHSIGELDWQEEHREQLKANCATIAIMKYPKRLKDIDRAIPASADSALLLDSLKLVTERLTYTRRPQKQNIAELPDLQLIRKQIDLLEYFKLRHRIYRIMGYLDEDIETTRSQMEIDWCDKNSLHIGAYMMRDGTRGSLVGCARVVVATRADITRRPDQLAKNDRLVTDLASSDPVLCQVLSRGILPLQLPIFHSQRLFGTFKDALQRGDVCAELSRVIVTETYRGSGLSRRLVDYALSEAAKLGVNRVFLECLDIHQNLYEKTGFKRINAASARVIGVNQTMVGMELSAPLKIEYSSPL